MGGLWVPKSVLDVGPARRAQWEADEEGIASAPTVALSRATDFSNKYPKTAQLISDVNGAMVRRLGATSWWQMSAEMPGEWLNIGTLGLFHRWVGTLFLGYGVSEQLETVLNGGYADISFLKRHAYPGRRTISDSSVLAKTLLVAVIHELMHGLGPHDYIALDEIRAMNRADDRCIATEGFNQLFTDVFTAEILEASGAYASLGHLRDVPWLEFYPYGVECATELLKQVASDAHRDADELCEGLAGGNAYRAVQSLAQIRAASKGIVLEGEQYRLSDELSRGFSNHRWTEVMHGELDQVRRFWESASELVEKNLGVFDAGLQAITANGREVNL